MEDQENECQRPSAVFDGFRILERQEWIRVEHLHSADTAKARTTRWRGLLESVGDQVLFTRCVVETEKLDDGGDLWASVWMVAGIRLRT